MEESKQKSVYKQLGITNFKKLRWLDTFMANHKGFIAGGCFKNILSGEAVKDVDIFFEKKEDYVEAVDFFYNDNSQKEGWGMLYENERAIAFFNTKTNIRVELISTIYGSPEFILSNFDFTITKMAYYKQLGVDEDGEEGYEYKLIAHEDFFEHLYMKRLVLDNEIPFPLSTFNRSYRYAKYGYFLCKESSVKLLNSLGADDIDGTNFYDMNGWD